MLCVFIVSFVCCVRLKLTVTKFGTRYSYCCRYYCLNITTCRMWAKRRIAGTQCSLRTLFQKVKGDGSSRWTAVGVGVGCRLLVLVGSMNVANRNACRIDRTVVCMHLVVVLNQRWHSTLYGVWSPHSPVRVLQQASASVCIDLSGMADTFWRIR